MSVPQSEHNQVAGNPRAKQAPSWGMTTTLIVITTIRRENMEEKHLSTFDCVNLSLC